MATTGLVWHELYMWHDTANYAGVVPFGFPVQPGQHAENPDTKRRLKNLLDVSGLGAHLQPIAPRPASDVELLRFHTPEHLATLRAHDGDVSFDLGQSTVMGRGSEAIARLAAGGVIAAVDAVLDGQVRNAYALVRPPGHHAVADRAMGFCLYSNAALAGLHALEARGLARIAFVDWDVHHGNGTQAAFWRDPRALTVSIHQDRNYPQNSGMLDDVGEGPGAGFNINVPLPPGSGTGAPESVIEQIVVPALRRFRPELIFIPCGFDAGGEDPLGRQMLTSESYRAMTARMMALADELCGGRLVLSHEGGSSAHTVPFFGLAVIEQLSGVRTGVVDPFQEVLASMGQQELQPHQQALIDAASTALGRLDAAMQREHPGIG